MGDAVNADRPVLLTADAVGGVWTWALDLAQGLTRRGFSVVFAVLGPPPSEVQRASARSIPGLELHETALALDWLAEDPREIDEASRALADLAAQTQARVAHLHSPALAVSSFPCPVVASVHSCLATWWSAVKGTQPLPDDFRWRIASTRAGLMRAHATTAPSLAFAEAVAQAYGVARPKVVHNGRARPPFDDTVEREECALTAGRLWDEGKNVAAIDRAAARLDVPVYAAGPVQGPNGVHAQYPALLTLGVLDDAAMAARMRSAPVYVSSARYEPFGLSVLEAAQSGAALVLSDIPVFRELWSGAALFTSPDDDLDIAASIDTLLNDELMRARLAAAARRRAAQFGVDAMAAKAADVYATLAVDREVSA
jgi:glycogen(starch) synthase